MPPRGLDGGASKLYDTQTDDVYDDACDLGQFCLNPCWFMFVKLGNLCKHLLDLHTTSTTTNSIPSKASTMIRDGSCEKSQHLVQQTRLTVRVQQTIYFVTVFGSWTIMFHHGYPLFYATPHVSNYHMMLGYLVFVLCVLSWRLASCTSPGNITQETMHRYDNYAYDNLLYRPNQICPTLEIRKLPRSKYDRYSDKHVPRFDHFCGWINQSVGEENYRFFIFFLAVHAIMCIYGSIITFLVLWGEATISNDSSSWWMNKVISLASVNYSLTAVLVWMGFMSFLLMAFLSFHLFLIGTGMTTNEYYKWKLVKERHTQATAAHVRQKHRHHDGDEEDMNACDPGLLPSNLYNLGVFPNFLEVIFPRSVWQRTHHQKKN